MHDLVVIGKHGGAHLIVHGLAGPMDHLRVCIAGRAEARIGFDNERVYRIPRRFRWDGRRLRYRVKWLYEAERRGVALPGDFFWVSL